LIDLFVAECDAGGVTLLPIIDRIRKEIDLEGISMVLCE
jgi:hypothetical protein